MEAVSAIVKDSCSRALYLSNFSLILKTEFERTESTNILNGFINVIMEASTLTPENHSHNVLEQSQPRLPGSIRSNAVHQGFKCSTLSNLSSSSIDP